MSDAAAARLTPGYERPATASAAGRNRPATRQTDPAAVVLAFEALDIVARVSRGGQAGDDRRDVGIAFRLSGGRGGEADATGPSGIDALPSEARRDGEGAPGGAAPSREGGALDPVVARLAAAFETVEDAAGDHAGLMRDALQLAIAARLAGLHAAPPAPAPVKPETGLLPWRLKRVREFVDAHLCEPITLADIAGASGLSRMYFAAQFRVSTGMRPHEFVLRRRIDRACELLLSTAMPIAEVALAVGFQTQAHFTTVFKRFVDETPYRWRKAHRRN